MKKTKLLLLSLCSMLTISSFAQMADGNYTFANNELTVEMTIIEDGWTISSVTVMRNSTKETIKGTGYFRNEHGLEWYEFQTEQCNYNFEVPSQKMTLEQFDCKNTGDKKYVLIKK